MKRFRFILLLAALLAAGFPALAQENDTRMTVQEREQETRIKIIENRMIIEHLPKEAILEIYNIQDHQANCHPIIYTALTVSVCSYYTLFYIFVVYSIRDLPSFSNEQAGGRKRLSTIKYYLK